MFGTRVREREVEMERNKERESESDREKGPLQEEIACKRWRRGEGRHNVPREFCWVVLIPVKGFQGKRR